MIFTDGARTQGPAYLEDAPLSWDETIGAAAGAAFHELPVQQVHGIYELQAASGEREDLGGAIARVQAGESPADVMDNPRAVPEVPIDQAKARVREAGLDTVLHLPDQSAIRKPALDIMLDRAREKRERDLTAQRGAAGFIPNSLAVGTSFLVGAIDPINIASAFIPVMGEMRYAKLLADAAATLPKTALERAGVRVGVGAAQGAVGSVPLTGLEAYARHQEGQDFTMADALRNLVMGTILGGGLHSIGGGVADVWRFRRERPLYPFDVGEPLEFHTPYSELRAPRTPGTPVLPELLPGREPVGSPPIAPDAARPEAAAEPEFRTGAEMPAPASADLVPAPDAAGRIRAKVASEEPAGPEPAPRIDFDDSLADLGGPSPVVRGLDDLPPRAKEDAMRAAIADLAEGRPVAVGEMLEAAAKTDPRIAESIEAWHGSPHDFERFDISHLGSGEGAQTYGHGLYFAENEGVARFYQENVRTVSAMKGQEAGVDEAMHWLKQAGDDIGKARKLYVENAKRNGEQPAAAVLDILNDGHVYQVRIKAHRDHFLDWNVTLDEQPAGRKLLKDMEPKLRDELEERLEDAGYSGDLGALTGSELHQLLIKHVGDDYELPGVKLTESGNLKQEVAHYLLGKGVAGIKYLDSGSRPGGRDLDKLKLNAEIYRMEHEQELARGGDAKYQRERREAAERELADAQAKIDNPTRNLVVFDPDVVEITHKNGEPVSRGERAEILREKQNNAVGAGVVQGPRAARGPRARDPETWSLNEFIASRGGLDPTDPLIGDVRHSIGASNKFVPGFGHLIRKGGMKLDEAREAAVEAGYLFDAGDHTGGVAESDIKTLLDAVDRELRGQRVYRGGREPEKAFDHEQHRVDIEREAHGALRDEGIQGVPDNTMARVVEIMEREGERDPLVAYERAVMEETHYGAETGQHKSVADTVPEWAVHDDAGAASRAGADPLERGQGGAGGAARAARDGNREAPGGAAGLADDWQALANRPAEYDHPDVLEASHAAARLEEPASSVPTKRQAAAEQAAAIAEQQYKDAEAYLPQDLRDRVDHELKLLAQEGADTAEIIRRGAACMVAGAGSVA